MSERGAPARHVIVVCSGKGGVGKSTLSLNLALALSAEGHRTGLLDADFHGPDIPLMVGITRSKPLRSWTLSSAGGTRIEPVDRFGLRIMSAGFLLGDRQHMFAWGPMTDMVAMQMLFQVDWGPLDLLVIDFPPGAADAQLEMLRHLAGAVAVVVVGPQQVTHLDSRRLVELLRERQVRVAGGVENMSSALCPDCGKEIELFPRGAGDRTIWSLGVPELARVPILPALSGLTPGGEPSLVAEPDGQPARIFRALARTLVSGL